jgi:hypothetical protein
MIRTAACSCGQLSARCQGEPAKVSVCHCLACQRRTGPAFGIAAFFPREAVGVSGQAAAFIRPSDSGHLVTHHFCPSCGSTVYWEPSRRPETIAVGVGAFADPSFPPPSQAVNDQDRHRWVTLDL